jgi:hypothetical protein
LVYDDSDNSLDATGSLTYNATTGHYQYDFTPFMDLSKTYTANIDFGVSALTRYVSCSLSAGATGAGLTTEEHNKLFSLENSTGGGFIRNTGLDAIDKKYLKETHEKVMTLENTDTTKLEKKLNEIDSHIELAKEETIDTIKEAETEVCSDIIRKTEELKKDNITTRNLVRQKTKKIDENVSKLSDRQDKTDKMIESEADEIEKLIEQNIDFEADEIEKLIQEQIDKEIEEIESNQSNDGNNNGTEGEVQGTPN